MNFPPNSQDSPRSMSEAGGYWDGFVNGDDSFHNVINMLDFPLESVEGDKCVAEENWEAQFPSLGPFSSEIVQGFTPLFRSDFAEDVPYNFVQYISRKVIILWSSKHNNNMELLCAIPVALDDIFAFFIVLMGLFGS